MNEHINKSLWEKAGRLAEREYTIDVSEETLTNDEKIFFVENPELRGCMAQGSTVEDALEELREARINYIYFLLVDGLEVPDPDIDIVYTTGTASLEIDFRIDQTSGVVGSSRAIDDNEELEPNQKLDNKQKKMRFSTLIDEFA